MDLKYFREQIDIIDNELLRLFVARMKLSNQIANYKKEHHLPIYDQVREQEILQLVAEKVDPDFEESAQRLYSLLFELSRNYQNKCCS